MTDRTIPTDEDRRIARDWAAHIIRAPYTSMPMESVAARVILDAVPAPPPKRPTLADMPPEERAACQWMQADVTIQGGRYVIVDPCDMDGEVGVVFEGGEIAWLRPECVTPRPDLPRMTWPGDQQPAPAPEVMPGVTVGEPVTDHDVMLGISIEAPDGTVVVGHAPDCHPKATVKSGGSWQSVTGMRVCLCHALGALDYDELESVTVVRWGKETTDATDQ